MKKLTALAVSFALLSGCASSPRQDTEETPVQRSHEGKMLGGAGGAVAGGAMAYSSAGLLCTIGGPLCMAFILPAAILGGAVGLAAGSVVDAARDASTGGSAPLPADTSARPDESARAEAPPPPY